MLIEADTDILINLEVDTDTGVIQGSIPGPWTVHLRDNCISRTAIAVREW